MNLNSQILASSYLEQFGSRSERLDQALRLSRQFPDRPRALMNAAIAFIQQGDLKRGGQNLQKAHQLDPDDPLITFNLATVLMQVNQFNPAINFLSVLERDDPDNFAVLYYLSLAYFYTDEKELSIEYITKAEPHARDERERQLVAEHRKALGLN
jgi:predicted Zn-dependent protease